MHPTTVKKFIFLLVVALATLSLVSSLSIPRRRDVKNAKKAVGRAKVAAAAAAPAAPPVRVTSSARAATSKKVTSAPPATRATTPPRTSAAADSSAPDSASSASTSAVPSQSSSAATDDMSTDSASAPLSTTNSSVVPSTSTDPSASTVPTGGLSTSAVGAIAAVGCLAVLGAGIFAFTRYKRKASLTQNLSTKSINQYSATPYSPSPFPQSNNTGYERLSDPSLSAPSSVPSGAPQGVGIFSVISTYTPTLGDELEIQPGDKVLVLVEYDDGWCQGVNESRGGAKGVFPKHCVDIGNQSGGMDDMAGNKRVSSMYGAGYRM